MPTSARTCQTTQAKQAAAPWIMPCGTFISPASIEHNIQDASDAWTLNINDDDNLRGLPEAVLARAEEDAKNASLSGWLLSLDYPTYDAVLKHADSRDLREAMYRGWVTRASDQGKDPKWDNSDNIEKILALRHEASNLVGFKSYAE